MLEAKSFMDVGMAFHGHKCPAMPLGLRAGVAAMNVLRVDRAQDKELHVISETGKGHAAGCFLDGIMTATGCTYGKSNIEKLYYNKMAFTLIEVATKRSVRVSLQPDFFGNMMQSPFVKQRQSGVLPQDVPAEIADPLVEKVLSLPETVFLDIGPIITVDFKPEKGIFTTECCSLCGERVFSNKLVAGSAGKICLGCQALNVA